MILATRSSAKTFSFVGKQAGASIPTCSTENGGAKFRKKKNGIASEMRSKPRLSDRWVETKASWAAYRDVPVSFAWVWRR
jgi:hypothetical protein